MNSLIETHSRHLSDVRTSLARNGRLSINLAPSEIYAFNSATAFGSQLPAGRREGIETRVRDYALEHPGLSSPDRLVSRLRLEKDMLSAEDRAELSELSEIIRRKGLGAQAAFEKAVAEDGFGQPAVLAVVLVVAVAIALFVWVVQEA